MRREDRAEVPSSAQGGTGSGFLEKAVPSVLMDEQTLAGREEHFRGRFKVRLCGLITEQQSQG